MIGHAIASAHKRMVDKKWDKIYVLVDIHNTIFVPSYRSEEKYYWFDGAMKTLQYMTKCRQISLILWTSSYEKNINEYLKVFEENGIHFDYVNENPEVKNDELGCYDGKLYFNVGIDDKFGFNAQNGDWNIVYERITRMFV